MKGIRLLFIPSLLLVYELSEALLSASEESLGHLRHQLQLFSVLISELAWNFHHLSTRRYQNFVMHYLMRDSVVRWTAERVVDRSDEADLYR